jgi:hypothetical protein
MSANNELFQEEKKRKAILLVDRSGSTGNNYGSSATVFGKMCEVCESLNHDEYRIVFWNSTHYNEGRFVNGVMVIPFLVKPSAIKTAFYAAASVSGGTTEPAIGFRAIQPEWLVDDPMVYFITDGMIGCSNLSNAEATRQLVEEIRKLSCQLSIIAVETEAIDANDIENANSIAGGDVYRAIRSNRLTSKVSKFISYNPAGRFVQINKVHAPAGFAPYGDKYFSILRVNEFMEHLSDELKTTPDESAQLAIAQKLSATLEVLTRDRPARMTDDIVRTFASLFTVDNDMIRYIITGAIEQERGGQAQLFANYRSQLKSLFAQADGLIKQDVSSAVGMRSKFISVLTSDRVLTGSYRLADKSVSLNNHRYPRAGYSETIPVFPLLQADTKMTPLQDQCLRQWIRCVYSAIYSVHPTADEIIYLVMGDMLKVCTGSAATDDVKNGYRSLAQCILRKKRLNSTQTEMECLMSGNLPIPNSGKYEDFIKYMNSVSQKLELKYEPMQLWYKMCSALDPMLALRQKTHCEPVDAAEHVSNVAVDSVPDDTVYDYECVITLEDLSQTGGYRILPHNGIAGQCSPVYLISSGGLAKMTELKQLICPVCYHQLRDSSFEEVGPKVDFKLPESYAAFAERFVCIPDEPVVQLDQKVTSLPLRKTDNKTASITNKNGVCGKLVCMKGTVGAGKSHAAAAIKAVVEARGGVCIVEGTDKYTKTGMQFVQALASVTNALKMISTIDNDDLVVVIDTCGDFPFRLTDVFRVNFANWQVINVWPNYDARDPRGYFAWSLRNVLLRRQATAAETFSLTPASTTVGVCISVHRKKCKALFAQEQFRFWSFGRATVYSLRALADAYAARLPAFVVPSDI